MSQQTTGTIKELYQEKTYGNKGFKKREFVITTEDKYPQDVIFETHSEMCAKLNQFKVGERVTVDYNLRGREYQGKYYNNLQAWRLSHSNQTEVSDQLPDRSKETADLPF